MKFGEKRSSAYVDVQYVYSCAQELFYKLFSKIISKLVKNVTLENDCIFRHSHNISFLQHKKPSGSTHRWFFIFIRWRIFRHSHNILLLSSNLNSRNFCLCWNTTIKPRWSIKKVSRDFNLHFLKWTSTYANLHLPWQ